MPDDAGQRENGDNSPAELTAVRRPNEIPPKEIPAVIAAGLLIVALSAMTVTIIAQAF